MSLASEDSGGGNPADCHKFCESYLDKLSSGMVTFDFDARDESLLDDSGTFLKTDSEFVF